MAKLRNIDAVKGMLKGSHRTQTKTIVGWQPDTKSREVGETWEDENGNTWEQKNGYKVMHGKFDELRAELNTFKKCPKEICTCVNESHLDKKMRIYHGMCFDCVVAMEHELRITNKFNDYAKTKVKENVLSWLKVAEEEKNAVKQAIGIQQYVNSDGTIEKWNPTYNVDDMKRQIDDEFDKLKKQLLNEIGETVNEETNIVST